MRLFNSLGFLLSGILIGVLAHAYYIKTTQPSPPMPGSTQRILLEQIKQVAKMVTVEGEFANVHQYNDSRWADVSFLRKKALIKVDARVSVGFDLQKAKFEVDAPNKIIRVRNLPQPEIIAIDHNLQYYDIQEGMFNNFSEAELSQIGSVAKQKLRAAVNNGPLMAQAKTEGLKNLSLIRLLVEQAGWTYEVIENEFIDDESPYLQTKDYPRSLLE